MRRILHLVRPGARPEVLGAHDWIVDLARLELAAHGDPPRPAGPIDHEQLIELGFAADLVITW